MIKLLERWGIRLTTASLWTALAGGVGAYVGFHVSSRVPNPFMDSGIYSSEGVAQLVLGQAIFFLVVGLILSVAILACDNYQSLRGRWNRDLLNSIPLFAGVAFLSGGFAQLIYSFIGTSRAPAWIIIGASTGACIGILRRDKTQMKQGAIGGAIGGFIGGVTVDAFLHFSFTVETFALASLIGMIVTGAMIGLFIRVVQDSLQKAWILGVSPGRYEGKTYPLNPDQVTVGKSELNDISLYLASELEMQNGAFICENGNWVWQGDAADINGQPQTNAQLNSGDTIRLGGTEFRFETRSTTSENAPASAPQTAPPTTQAPPPQVPRPMPQPSNASNRSIWILSGSSGKIQLPSAPAQVQLGRSDQNQICINDPSVSSQHAVIEVKASSLAITDLNSTNGTYINGERIAAEVAAALRDNDQLILGQQQYIVRFV